MKVKAIEKKLKFSKDPNDPGVYRYVMSPELYIALSQEKVRVGYFLIKQGYL